MRACFYPVESANAYLHSLQCYVATHGRPQALYSDRHSIFTKHDPEDPVSTQFERAVGELNIVPILTYTLSSPVPQRCRCGKHSRHEGLRDITRR